MPSTATCAAVLAGLLLLCGAACLTHAQVLSATGWSVLPFPTTWPTSPSPWGTSVLGPLDQEYYPIALPSPIALFELDRTILGNANTDTLWVSANGHVGFELALSISGYAVAYGATFLAAWSADFILPPPSTDPTGRFSYGLLRSGSAELAQVARFLAQPASRLSYAVLASWVRVMAFDAAPNVGYLYTQPPNTFQMLIAKGSGGETFVCFLYGTLGIDPGHLLSGGFIRGKGLTDGRTNPTEYALPGGNSGAGAVSVASSSGGWYKIGQEARNGTWCFTAHQRCASTPGGCPDVFPTTACGPNAVADFALGGPANNVRYASSPCACQPGWRVAPGESADVQGCRQDADECSETSNCIAPNTLCTNSAGSYECGCKPGYVLPPGANVHLQGCVLPSCPAPPSLPIAHGAWACAEATVQSGSSCAATCNDGFVGAPRLACTSAGTYAVVPTEQCRFNNSAGLPQFFLVVDGPLASFPPLSDAALAMFAVHIASGLNLPPPYSAASLVTWIQSLTLGGTGGQQALQLVVGYAVRPEAALPLQSIPLQAIASAPGTIRSIADGLHSAGGFNTRPGSSIIVAASDAAGKPLGPPVSVSADCTVSLTALEASPSACVGDASVSAAFGFSGRRVQGATTFTASLGGNECNPPPAPLQGSQTNGSVAVSCRAPSIPGVFNLTMTATYTATDGCSSGTVVAQTAVQVHSLPTVTITPVLASVPICAGSNATLEFAYSITAASPNEALQLAPSVSTSGPPATCSVVRQGTDQAGKLVVTCAGSFGPNAGPLAVTASLVATAAAGCSTSASATASVSALCCKASSTVAYAGAPAAASTCLYHVDPTDVRCRARPQVSRYGWVNKGELAAGSLQPDLGANCATSSAPVGSVSARCRVRDGALVFNVTTANPSAAELRYWLGCSAPAAATLPGSTARQAAAQARVSSASTCNAWRTLPKRRVSNAIELSVTTNVAITSTSWVWRPPPLAGNAGCSCADVFWAVHAVGVFAVPGGSC